MTRGDPGEIKGSVQRTNNAAYWRADPDEPTRSAQILDAVRHGNGSLVGKMLKKEPGLVYTVDPQAIIDEHYRFSQRPPLAIFAADHGQQTLARAIGVFSATGFWSETGQWPSARREIAARRPAAQIKKPSPGPILV